MENSFRRRMLPLTFAMMLIYGGFILAFASRYLDTGMFPAGVLDVVAGALIVIGFILFFAAPGTPFRRYFSTLLGVRNENSIISDDVGFELRSLRRDLKELRSSVSTDTVALSETVQAEILELYRKALNEKFADGLSTQIRALINEAFKKEIEFEATKYLSEVNGRLQAASSTVSARGFLNLILGIAFAGGALYVLQEAIWLLTPDRLNSLPMSTVIYLTATRVSLAVVITFVSYFFLSLYKRSLEDAKFYQNEMTDISARATALQLAYYLGDKESRGYVLARFMESDRNRALLVMPPKEGSPSFGEEMAKKLMDKLPSIKTG